MAADRDTAWVKYNTSIVKVIGDYVSLTRSGNNHVGRCPFHDDTTPSMTVHGHSGDGANEGGWFNCFGCGAAGDVFDFLRRYHGVGHTTALRMCGADAQIDVADLHERPVRTADKQRWVDRIWEGCDNLQACSPVGDYLSARAIPIADLGLMPNLRQGELEYRGDRCEHPVLVAALRNGVDKLVGIQRTYLTRQGRKLDVENPKLSLGLVRGAAIKLGDETEELTICEGLEDGLSLRYANPDRTVWVAAGGNMMAALPVPETCKRIYIARDNDRAGGRSAHAAAISLRRVGREILVMSPSPEFKDFNAELMGSVIL